MRLLGCLDTTRTFLMYKLKDARVLEIGFHV